MPCVLIGVNELTVNVPVLVSPGEATGPAELQICAADDVNGTGCGAFAVLQTGGDGTEEQSVHITGLRSDTRFAFFARGHVSSTGSPPLPLGTCRTKSPPPRTGADLELAAPPTASTLHVRWRGPLMKSFTIQWWPAADPAAPRQRTRVLDMEVVLKGLRPATAYAVRLRATSRGGSGPSRWSDTAVWRTTAPDAALRTVYSLGGRCQGLAGCAGAEWLSGRNGADARGLSLLLSEVAARPSLSRHSLPQLSQALITRFCVESVGPDASYLSCEAGEKRIPADDSPGAKDGCTCACATYGDRVIGRESTESCDLTNKSAFPFYPCSCSAASLAKSSRSVGVLKTYWPLPKEDGAREIAPPLDKSVGSGHWLSFPPCDQARFPGSCAWRLLSPAARAVSGAQLLRAHFRLPKEGSEPSLEDIGYNARLLETLLRSGPWLGGDLGDCGA